MKVDRQKGLAAGATTHLVKPYFDDLAATISQIITNKEKPDRTNDLNNIEAIVRFETDSVSANFAD